MKGKQRALITWSELFVLILMFYDQPKFNGEALSIN